MDLATSVIQNQPGGLNGLLQQLKIDRSALEL